MNLIRNTLLGLALAAVVISCGKKDVKNDAPIANAQAEAAPAPAPAPTPVDEVNDLKIVYFDFDKSNLTSSAKSDLKANVDWLKKNAATTVEVEGHCDERGTDEYNHKLGEKRAHSVKHYLTSHGIKGKRVKTTSFGKTKPADPGHDEAAWAKNRRASFRILSGK